MNKHTDHKTKYHYATRYINGESPTSLGIEVNPYIKEPIGQILVWTRKYIAGAEVLKRIQKKLNWKTPALARV